MSILSQTPLGVSSIRRQVQKHASALANSTSSSTSTSTVRSYTSSPSDRFTAENNAPWSASHSGHLPLYTVDRGTAPTFSTASPSSVSPWARSTQRSYFHTSSARRARTKGHYEVLSLPRNATRQQVKARFYEVSQCRCRCPGRGRCRYLFRLQFLWLHPFADHQLSKKHHPDTPGGSTAKFHEINDAYATLGDESKRSVMVWLGLHIGRLHRSDSIFGPGHWTCAHLEFSC
jgi:hypothetical protein